MISIYMALLFIMIVLAEQSEDYYWKAFFKSLAAFIFLLAIRVIIHE